MKKLLLILLLLLAACEYNPSDPCFPYEPNLIDYQIIHNRYEVILSPILLNGNHYELVLIRGTSAYHYWMYGQDKRINYVEYLPALTYDAEVKLYNRSY